MKMVKQVVEVEGEGLESLLGEYVVLWCMNYIYSGKLVGVNSTCCLLEEAHVVYETGPLKADSFKDAQPLPEKHYVSLSALESFGKRGF